MEKGIGVVVTGRLEQRSYEDKDGVKRSAVDLIADEIGIATRSLETIERRAKQEGTTQSNGGQQANNRPKTGPARTMPMTNKAIQFTPETEEEPF